MNSNWIQNGSQSRKFSSVLLHFENGEEEWKRERERSKRVGKYAGIELKWQNYNKKNRKKRRKSEEKVGNNWRMRDESNDDIE